MSLALLVVLSSWPALAQAPVEIYPSIHKGAGSLKQDEVIHLVQQQFGLLSPSTPYARVGVSILYDDVDQPDALIVTLAHRDSYLMETAKVALGLYYAVQSVQWDYVEDEDDTPQSTWNQGKASCPDESVEIVYASYNTEIPTAVAAANKAYELATQSGYKAVKLIGAEASVTNYKNYLSCKGLKVLGNIGHGSTSGIMIGGGTLSSSYFSALPQGSLTPKVLYFNSCQVHNSPLEPAILTAGASRFIGGNVDLEIGSSEEVFKCFWEEALRSKGPMEPILTNCEATHYNQKGAHGISGAGPLPWGVNGATCTSNDQCMSKFCVNDVCCESACNGECQACNLQGSLGKCLPAPDGYNSPDGDVCNGAEKCQAGKRLAGTPLTCEDSNPCTENKCDAVKGCQHPSMTNGTKCLNDNLCDGEEICQEGQCAAGSPLNCDDGQFCTTDRCEPKTGCLHDPLSLGTDCSNNQCGPAICNVGLCVPEDTKHCDDGNVCTADTCESVKGCVNQVMADGTPCGGCMSCQRGQCLPVEQCSTFAATSFSAMSCSTSSDQASWFGLLMLAFALTLRRWRLP